MLKENCSKHNDKNLWATSSPFFTDKRFRNANNIILRENDNIVTDPSRVSELFNDCFSSVAMDIVLTTVSPLLVTQSPSTFHTQVLLKYEIDIIREVVLV